MPLISDSNQTVSSFRDVGIHDLDLFDYLIGIEDKDIFTINSVSNTYFANLTKQNNITASFLWSNEFYKKRTKHISCTREQDSLCRSSKL